MTVGLRKGSGRESEGQRSRVLWAAAVVVGSSFDGWQSINLVVSYLGFHDQ